MFVNDGIQIHIRWDYINEEIARANGNDPSPDLRSPHKSVTSRVNGVDITGDSSDAVLVAIHYADEVSHGLFFKMTTVNDVNFFAFG